MATKFGIKLTGIALAGLAFLIATAPAFSAPSKLLKGGVEEENLRLNPSSGGRALKGAATDSLRITRAPRALQGSAVDATAFASPGTPQNAPLSGNLVDTNSFAQPPKNFDIGAERGSREMTLAWERWHHQLSQAIYTRWQRIARDPGKALVRVYVTRNLHITAQIVRGSGNPEFDDCIAEAIQSLDGNPGLTFPAKSERQQVSFEADYIAGSDVTPGYSWVKNDYEKVKENY